MFREIRRKRQILSKEESESILERMTSGVLAVHGDDGYPYAVPLSYVYVGGRIYFHSALAGHKVDALQGNDKVSFCVVEKDEVVPPEFTTYYRSVIVFGRARILSDREEKLRALRLLSEKYSPGESGTEAEIAKGFDRLHMIEINVEHISGKEAIELARKKDKMESHNLKIKVRISKKNDNWRKVVCDANFLAPMIYPNEWWEEMDVTVNGRTYQWKLDEIEKNLEELARTEQWQLPVVATVTKDHLAPRRDLPFKAEHRNVLVVEYTIDAEE